jgi:hypothetical protein
MFKRNVSITGFGIGHFINAATGAAVTTGTPTCKRTLDGTGGACANAASYNTDGAVWEIDLDAADMNGDVVVLSFTLADCLPIAYTIRTSTKLVSDLNDYAGGDTSGTTTLLTRLSEARAGALTDWIDGGRLDLLIDAIKAKTDLGLLNTTWTDAKAGYLDEAISAAKTLTAAYDAAKTAAAPGAAMTLTSGERTTLAAAIEAAIINELDGTAVMQAIADLIASDMTTGDLSVVAIATATRDAILNRVLAGNHDTASTAGKLLQFLDAAISSRHASGAAVAKSPATLDWSADVTNKPVIGTSTFNPATDTVANVTTVATCTTNTDMRGTDGAYTGTPPTAEAIADQVWDEATAGHTGAGSYGKAVGDGVTTWVTATGFSTHSAADVVTALGTGSTLTACLTATGFSTFNAASDKVYLANGAHGGAAASITLADYSDFQGAAGTDASTIYTYFTAESRQNAFKADVTELALEATLTAMKGSGWTDETLKAIRDKLPANLEDLNITDTTGLVRPDMANASGNYSGTVATVTTLTNAPTDMATATNQTTILNRLGAFTGSGVNTVLGFFKALLSKAATLPTDVGGTFDPAADSTEAIRDRGDAAWITAAGTSTVTITDIENIAIETDVTLKQALQRIGAIAAGKVSGAGTGTEVFVGMDGTTTRVTVTVDTYGNRSAITYDA